MGQATREFFEKLNSRGFDPLLRSWSGTVRIDLHDEARAEHWLIDVDHGRVRATQEEREADTVVETTPELFDKIVTGRENSTAALIRGDLTIRGEMQTAVRLGRMFPGPPDATGPRPVARKEVR